MNNRTPTCRLADLPAETPPVITRALEAVFGDEVPLPESIQLKGTGRTRVKLGFITTGLRLRAEITYDFPDRRVGEFADRAHWDSTVTFLGLLVGAIHQAYDGEVGYQKVGTRERLSDERMTESLRRRLWAESIALLFPLVGLKIEVRDETDHSAVLVSEDGDLVTVEFDPDDGRPVSVTYDRYQEDVERYVPVTLELGRVKVVGSLPVLSPVHTRVEGTVLNGYSIESVAMNPSLDDIGFVLR